MKISITLGLLGATIVPTLVPMLVWAQPVAQPTTFISDEKAVLTPEFVREADTIIVAHLVPDNEDAVITRVLSGSEVIRGPKHSGANGLILPTGTILPIGGSPLLIVFGKIDPVSRRMIVTAHLDATPELIDQVRRLATANQKVSVSFSTDKAIYALADPIVMQWKVRNTSPQTLSIYTGSYALQFSAKFGGSSRSNGSGGSENRKPTDYTTLAPGETWMGTRRLDGPFPEGKVALKMTFNSLDNFLGDDASPDTETERAKQKRLDNVALFQSSGSVEVAVKASSADTPTALSAQLKALEWSQALPAAVKLSQIDGASQLPQVRALADHPWDVMRKLAATALARGGKFGPELHALVYDPSPRVRSSAFEQIDRNKVPGAGLAALAVMVVENEAATRGLLKSPFRTGNPATIYNNSSDNRDLGDLLAERISSGRAHSDGIDAPYLLNFLAENQRKTRLFSDTIATAQQEQEVLAAWKNAPSSIKPANLKSRTAAELNAEIVLARASMFTNFEVGPQFADIVTDLQKIDASHKIFVKTDDPAGQFLENLAPAARLDVWHALQWKTGGETEALNSLPALKAVAEVEGPNRIGAQDFLLNQLYNAVDSNSALDIYGSNEIGFAAAVALGYSDFARARPHLEAALKARDTRLQMGAATGLLVGGQKSAVPEAFLDERWSQLVWLDTRDLFTALQKITEQPFDTADDWKQWWNQTGSKMDWK